MDIELRSIDRFTNKIKSFKCNRCDLGFSLFDDGQELHEALKKIAEKRKEVQETYA